MQSFEVINPVDSFLQSLVQGSPDLSGQSVLLFAIIIGLIMCGIVAMVGLNSSQSYMLTSAKNSRILVAAFAVGALLAYFGALFVL